MTASTLRSYTLKDLAKLARRRGVNGWQGMRKDQLVRAILRNGASHAGSTRAAKPKASPPKAIKKPTAAARRTERAKPAPAVRKARLRPTPAQLAAARRLEVNRAAKKTRVMAKIEQ